MFEDKEWRTEVEQLERINQITASFHSHIKSLSLEPADNPSCLQNLSNNRYLPDHSMVLKGSDVFGLFFDGTKFEDVDERDNMVTKSLRTEWYSLDRDFQSALADIAEETKDSVRTKLADWYEVLKKVMRLWNERGDLAKNSKVVDNKSQTSKGSTITDGSHIQSDADEFYVFLYDELDEKSKQAQFRRASQRFKKKGK